MPVRAIPGRVILLRVIAERDRALVFVPEFVLGWAASDMAAEPSATGRRLQDILSS
ncbi:MAG TPA: hypothetical protein H9871_07385 [Candidatus Nesterenkonia stercoripullorum]|uniref:Uncharacterized protein n=1 Tax=Candidatus Nesterenkonia stercoripullorum TaxID=2838701 RepID=A0A9D1UT77_9MICC|nr:hypothetical protein [Candidatus Nesterenkonia stercoripullorum]